MPVAPSSSEAAMGPLHWKRIYFGRELYLHSSAQRISRSGRDGPPYRLNADHRCARAIATGIAELHRRQRPRSYYMPSLNRFLEGTQARIRQNAVTEPPTFLFCTPPFESTQRFPRNPRVDQYRQGSPCVVQSQASNVPK